jgi:hypothetical protein
MDRVLANLNPLTEWAIAFISVVGLFFQIKWSRRGIALGPTLLTTLGIFFCFLGIALGLADFDPADARGTVPHLLQGIRTSFWASVSGIAWALSIKIRFVLLGDRGLSVTGAVGGATMEDLVNQLQRIHRAIASTDESSLASLARGARVETNLRLDQLAVSLDSHAARVAEANGKALVGALAEVVSEFNTTVNEQFGGNFVELNVAVGRLVSWQSQYQEQLNALILQETATRQSMAAAAERYAALVENSQAFVQTAQSLATMLTELEAQRQGLTAGLGGFATLIDKASNGLPQIEQSIIAMTEQIARGVQGSQEQLADIFKKSWQSIQVHNQQLTLQLTKSFDTASSELTSHIRQTNDNALRQVVAVDKALEQEVAHAMTSLSRQLTQVAQDFVHDYTPLINRMQQLLTVARA